MNRLTIGEFARASRLTQKALRLYDELGLLPPAHVDPRSGYRTYDLAQLERAQLVCGCAVWACPWRGSGWCVTSRRVRQRLKSPRTGVR
ncbi:MAG TPA: MerR family transcriptional regulator [Pseudonocardiaceae bacterium]